MLSIRYPEIPHGCFLQHANVLSFGNAQENQPVFHFFPTDLERSLEQVENMGEQGFDIFGWVFQFYEKNALRLRTGLRTVGPEQVREQGSEQGAAPHCIYSQLRSINLLQPPS